jgi:hypothetical protein
VDDRTLDEMAESVAQIEATLKARRDKLRAELNTVERSLARATSARLALTGEPEPPQGVATTRRRKLGALVRQNEILAWAKTRDGWWTIRDLADAREETQQSLAPSVGKLVERGELERAETDPPQYRAP